MRIFCGDNPEPVGNPVDVGIYTDARFAVCLSDNKVGSFSAHTLDC
jgi:hypothetical protein